MSQTQGEHTFSQGILVSGENIDSYTAGEALSRGVGVEQTGDWTVSECSADTTDFTGVVAYDVSNGEEVAVIKRDCEVRIQLSESVDAGDELIPDGSGGWESVATASASAGFAVANEGGGNNDWIVAEITAAGGATT